MFESEGAIGVMDSGVGGVSVLNALRLLLPYENYVYLSDSMHAPYGRRAPNEIAEIVVRNADQLIAMGCKALVVACNTATAVAVSGLRECFPQTPIVGLEPAVRPALRYASENGGDVLVLATDVTVRENRFKRLCERCCADIGGYFIGDNTNSAVNHRDTPLVYALSIQKTVDFVEMGQGNSALHTEYLKECFSPYRNRRFSAVVEGCTHFPFAEKSISDALGYQPRFFDGAHGAARRVRELLSASAPLLLSKENRSGWVEWLDTAGKSGYAEKFRLFSLKKTDQSERK